MQPAPWPLARAALAVAALWAVPAVIALGQISIEQTLAGEPIAWHAALWTTLPNWVLWALLTPPVVWLAARVEPGTAPVWQVVGAHIVGAAAALAVHALGNVAAFRLAGLPSDWTWGTFETHYALRFPVNVVAYGLVVAATWALLAAGRARERERREAALEADLALAELRALRMQVRPHFLFNALHAVGATVRMGEPDRAVTMLGQLGDLLRSSFEADGATEVPLARELDVLERYLALEAVRVGDRLAVTWDVEAEARAALVPAWVLQPLVENAVKYGVASHSDPATLTVRAHVEADRVRLGVEDDGPGPSGGTHGTGVGLSNTRARLEALYGDDATLTFRPRAGGGAVAEVTLPHRTP
ncbi:sensor histidine kinase [Rubrivirga marina]|uniref:sensor histidine kinase n=1 Tax=Rubrivirga marina TaxID=1196024 RepID=UPI0015C6E771|nr:histidine kinase [Rubrivirga marina]